MKTWAKILLGIIVTTMTLGVIGAIVFSIFWGQHGEMVSLENKIDAQYTANQSDYDKMWKTFVEMTEVTEMQAEQFKDVYTDLISGRYEGDDTLLKFVQESNPELGTEVYTQLQQQISADRAVFNNNQAKVIDVIREYNDFIQHSGIIIAKFYNKSAYDMNDYIITSADTEEAFESGQAESIQLRSKDGE